MKECGNMNILDSFVWNSMDWPSNFRYRWLVVERRGGRGAEFLCGKCCCDPETIILYHATFISIFQLRARAASFRVGGRGA